MRGTNYRVGFGIAILFLVAGIGMFVAGGRLFAAGTAGQDVAGAGDSVRMIGGIWAAVAALLIVVFAALRARASRRAKIVATGIPGTATVRAADQTGVYVNHQPQYQLTLDLDWHGRAAGKRVVTRAVVPLTAIGRWGLGSALPVRIDRENPDDFEIVWDELPVPGSQPMPAHA